MKQRALFLDRDGVINVDHGYVHRVEDFHFIEGIFDLCRYAHAQGWLIIVVTNQAGIARGFYTEQDFERLSEWMRERFVAERAPLTAVYYCPTHPSEGQGEYRRESARRKPNPGMLLDAEREHNVDLSRSVMVGDKPSDMEASKAAHVGTRILFDVGSESSLVKSDQEFRVSALAGVGDILKALMR